MAKTFSTITTQRLFFRGINEDDTDDVVRWRSLPEVYRYFKSPHKISVEEHKNWFRNSYLNNNNRFDWICIEKETGTKIGIFGLINNHEYAEISYLLDKKSQHKGYAREGIDALVRFAFERLKVERIIAEIHKENMPSIKLVEKKGFKLYEQKQDFCLYKLDKCVQM